MVATEAEVVAMRHALVLAAAPTAPHGPNPRVGCVLLDPAGVRVAEGYHRGAGTEHAEVQALSAAGERARGTTAVVTLEPCAHTGRTGPCAQALIAAGVVRVVFAQPDVSRQAAGGAAVLAAAGLSVEGGVLEDQARQLNRTWTVAEGRGRPFLTWKFAATMDGRVAAADGTSQWITGPEARADVHRWRGRADAILVGTGTVLADDPRLTVRDADGVSLPSPPTRVVMGLRDVPVGARINDDATPTLHLRTRDPAEALTELFGAHVRHVFLEGGPRLAGAFVSAGLVDRVIGYYAGRLLGAGPSALADTSVRTLAQAPWVTIRDVAMIGGDVRVVAETDS